MRRISFLHTADSSADLFSSVAEAAGFTDIVHHVRPDLLAEATELGGIDDGLEMDIRAAITLAFDDADQVLMTCSTLGPVADKLASAGEPILRTDGLLADAVLRDAAKQDGAAVAVLIVAPSTLKPTQSLFDARRAALSLTDVAVNIVLLPDLWALFLAGERVAYLEGLDMALKRFRTENSDYTHIALGQGSMAAAKIVPLGGFWTIPAATEAYLRGQG